jgi:hypothetical protein
VKDVIGGTNERGPVQSVASTWFSKGSDVKSFKGPHGKEKS